ncbi:hypothetical protein ACFS5M_14100 [Lacinutrix iliipiscaria]|uniref:Uncharacterized protein n=1 Tax=Lacinutrix iliipiscaria TaxID=1230532 RepID=A0ABW5WTQ0_9FLAO
MGKINWFRSYLAGLKQEFSEINSQRLLIDKSALTKYLEAHQSDNNLLLVGIMPDFGGKGLNADEFKLTNITQLMVLKKTTFSEINHEEFLDIFEETYLVIEKILEYILNSSREGCTELRFLNTQNIKLVPVWNLSSCNGWKIMLDFDMFV